MLRPRNNNMVIMQRDPTRTTILRDAFARQMRKRFNNLSTLIRGAVDGQDVLALKNPNLTTQQLPAKRAFDFPRSSQKIDAFMLWLRNEVDNGLLEITALQQVGVASESAWTNLYITDSYRRGVQNARYQLRQAGYDVPTIQASGGMQIIMGTPLHVDRVGLLYTRVFNELKGITDAMDRQISTVLAEGMANGLHPRTIARQMQHVVTGTGQSLGIRDTLGRFIPAKRRAEILARTEVIRSHAEAQLQEYENWGAEGVTAQVELVTAGDDRVCELCASLDGAVYDINEARGKIPVHPRCRCAWIPTPLIKQK